MDRVLERLAAAALLMGLSVGGCVTGTTTEPDATPLPAPVGTVAAWDFGEGGGEFIHDVSGVDPTTDLRIYTTGAVTWTDGGLEVTGVPTIQTLDKATKIVSAIGATSAFTLEAFIRPAAADYPGLSGPRRIVSLSGGTYEADLMLGQGRDDSDFDTYSVRVRRDRSELDGSPALQSTPLVPFVGPTHLVVTCTPEGKLSLYVNGKLDAVDTAPGALANWAPYALRLGNEEGGDRSWQGEFLYLAIYDRVMDDAEVATRASMSPP